MSLARTCLACVLGAAIALMGCTRFDSSGTPGDDQDANPTPDAPPAPDVLPGDPCLEWTPLPAHFDPCQIVNPQGGLTLDLPGTYTYDTDLGTLQDPQGNLIGHAREVVIGSDPEVSLVSVDSFLIGPDSTLRAVGSMPMLIASWSTITVDGSIDVSSSIQNGQGAGASNGTCNAAIAGASSFNGGGGGGGGGFGDDGGDGGDGGDGDGSKGSNGTKLGSPPANVRGGCPGAGGGYKTDANDGSGAGGAGGGALQLTAAQSIIVYGTLHAGGAGGRGGSGDVGGNDASSKSGGGGGGSGGMLGLEAPAIQIGSNAILAANGGGGGGGCDNGLATSGQDGPLDDTRANRGGKDGAGGNGGYGGFIGTPAGQPADAQVTSGGGGGGGGVGYIIMSTTPTITGSPKISPAYVTP